MKVTAKTDEREDGNKNRSWDDEYHVDVKNNDNHAIIDKPCPIYMKQVLHTKIQRKPRRSTGSQSRRSTFLAFFFS